MATHPPERFIGFILLIITFTACYFVIAPDSFLGWLGCIILTLIAFAIVKAINNARINSIRGKCKHDYVHFGDGEFRCKKCNHNPSDISGY